MSANITEGKNKMNLVLHKKDGVNPKTCYCGRCGGESSELMLIGNRDKKFTCGQCGVVSYGSVKCLKPDCNGNTGKKEKIGEYERLPSSEPCDNCQGQIDMVIAGGIFFKCLDCNTAGAIKPEHPLSINIRKQHKIEAPKPVGIEFTKNTCPVCRGDMEVPA